MDNKSYYVSKNKKKREAMYLEYETMNGYSVKPKVHEENAIEVSKIVFVNPEFSEKIIRKKIDRKIDYLLQQLRLIQEDDDSSEGTIKRSLVEAEKLRLQIINNYVKYLGNTYGSLTLKKLEIIIEELRYKLYVIKELDRKVYYENQKEGKRGR